MSKEALKQSLSADKLSVSMSFAKIQNFKQSNSARVQIEFTLITWHEVINREPKSVRTVNASSRSPVDLLSI